VLELVQFRHSPYNEKARWALDVKRVPHRRRSLLPGPHLLTVKRLTGHTTTPVLLHDGGVVDGSARIIDWLDTHYGAPKLVPSEPAERAEALRIQRWFDDDLTPRIRRTVLDALLRQPRYFADVFGDGLPSLQRMAYACVVPLARPVIRKGNGITGAAAVEDGHRAAAEALAFVASRSADSGYLCGKAFGVADITAASTLAVLVQPPDSPMSGPRPMASRFRALVERYADHPGAAWTRAVYARHRDSRKDFDGPSPQAA